MYEENVVHLHGGILFRYTQWKTAICSGVDEPVEITLSEIIQAEKDKHCRISLMWNLIRGLRKLASYKQEYKGGPQELAGRRNGVILVKRYKLSVKSSRDLMCSIGIIFNNTIVYIKVAKSRNLLREMLYFH